MFSWGGVWADTRSDSKAGRVQCQDITEAFWVCTGDRAGAVDNGGRQSVV